MDPNDFLFRACHCQGFGRRKLAQLLSIFMTKNLDLHLVSPHELAHLLNVPLKNATTFKHDWSRFNLKQIVDTYRQDHIQFITFFDDTFPPLLKAIPDPPLYLFLLGNESLLTHPLSLSVVGTRSPTKAGLFAMEEVLKPLVQEGWLFVSGLAKGVDAYAHQLALGSHTIAVLGSGFYHLYPKENQALFKKIAEQHVVVTEYPPQTRPQRWHFPERNRLISGLTYATLVVEAKQKSGSLITADQALEQGREVLAIPGDLRNPYAQGTNNLIKQGAGVVTSTDDLRAFLNVTRFDTFSQFLF